MRYPTSKRFLNSLNFIHFLLQKKEKLLSNNKFYLDSVTQTDSKDVDKELTIKEDWSIGKSEIGENIVDQVTKAAESAIQQTGFVYEETSGLYYDYSTGYYYDAVCKTETIL